MYVSTLLNSMIWVEFKYSFKALFKYHARLIILR
jgi:hypothetical protein